MSHRKIVIRKVLKSMNGSIDILSSLERDVPITSIASMEMNNEFSSNDLEGVSRESLKVAKKMNDYKKAYWKLEILIKQSFLDTLKKKGFLPGRSIEVESLANALPETIIKGDERIWIYSYDHYIPRISEMVGRDPGNAPSGKEIWFSIEKRFESRINKLVEEVNIILPKVFLMRSRLITLLKNDDLSLEDIRMKTPKVTPVSRPVRKVVILKRPIPLPRNMKKPRKRVLKKPEIQIIGPEEG
jgi:hypothetical protein